MDLAILVLHVLDQKVAKVTKRFSVRRMNGLGWGEDHAAVPHAGGGVASSDGQLMWDGAEATLLTSFLYSLLEGGIDDLVDTIAEHDDKLIVSVELNHLCSPIGQSDEETIITTLIDLAILTHPRTRGERQQETLVGVPLHRLFLRVTCFERDVGGFPLVLVEVLEVLSVVNHIVEGVEGVPVLGREEAAAGRLFGNGIGDAGGEGACDEVDAGAERFGGFVEGRAGLLGGGGVRVTVGDLLDAARTRDGVRRQCGSLSPIIECVHPRRLGTAHARSQRCLETISVLLERRGEAGDGHHPDIGEGVHHGGQRVGVSRGGDHIFVTDTDGAEGVVVLGDGGGGSD
mmetsp:Transcript_476/g.1015  ORF Transcript_476/g.1015 Transcript_476/m.1015 type:complete len:344 (+) Transcript_476:955-1986(+)